MKHLCFQSSMSQSTGTLCTVCYRELGWEWQFLVLKNFKILLLIALSLKTHFKTFTVLLNRGYGGFSVRRETAVVILKGNFGCWVGCWAAWSPASPAELHIVTPQLCVVPAPCLSSGAGQRPQLQVYSQGDMAKACVHLHQVLVKFQVSSSKNILPMEILFFNTLNFLSSCSRKSQSVILPSYWGF